MSTTTMSLIAYLREQVKREEALLETCIKRAEACGNAEWALKFVETERRCVADLHERLARLSAMRTGVQKDPP